MQNKISIIVPVYNAEKYIKECIDSVLSQNFLDFELLLIDDGSKDKSGKICDEYAKKDTRVRVFHQENQGVSIARNLGLQHATGEWIMFVDADDFIVPMAIELLLECTLINGADYVYGNTLRRNGNIDKQTIPNLRDKTWENDYGFLAHFGLWGCLFKASIISEHGISFIKGQAYGEDMIFKLMYLKYVKIIATIDKPVYIYRVNSESVTKSPDKIRSAHHQLMATKYLMDLTEMENDNPLYKNTLLRTFRSSRRQIFCDVAFNPIKEDRIEIIKDYYRVLGSTFPNKIQLYYNVWLLRFRRGIKTFLQKTGLWKQ